MALATEVDAPTSALNVAGMILLASIERGIADVTARKLQKLLYLTELYQVGLTGKSAFYEKLKAWDDGPVVPEVRYKFKGGKAPDTPITISDIEDLGAVKAAIAQNPTLFENVRKVIRDFGNLDQDELVELTHGQIPWLETWNEPSNVVLRAQGIKPSASLNRSTMKTFSRALLRHTRPDEVQKNVHATVARLHETPGDFSFVHAKMRLAEAAGELDYSLARGFSDERANDSRAKLIATLRDFTRDFGNKVGLEIDFSNEDELNAFARALTDFGMSHRTR